VLRICTFNGLMQCPIVYAPFSAAALSISVEAPEGKVEAERFCPSFLKPDFKGAEKFMRSRALVGSAKPGILPRYRYVLEVPTKQDVDAIAVTKFQALVLVQGD
jgi:hypothetical protein